MSHEPPDLSEINNTPFTLPQLTTSDFEEIFGNAIANPNLGAGVEVSGTSGGGKSNFAEWFGEQCFNRRVPFSFIDPHGDSSRKLIRILQKKRSPIKDSVLYVELVMNPKGMRLNVHDIEFLRNVGIYGLLTAEDARYSYPGYKDNSVQKRLRLLSQNGYLRAAQLAVAFGHGGASGGGGRLPSLYSLTPAGADLLESTTGERPARVLNSDIAPSTYLHRREISEVVQIFTRSCLSAGLPMPRWVLEQDVWKNAPLNLPPNQRRYLYHAMSIGNKRFVCQPDIACLLQLPSSPVVLYWEIDRSTEGRKQLREPAKTDAYLTLMGTQGFQRYWPDVPNATFQFVFWVCPTPERLESLRQVFKDHEISKYMRLSHRRVFTADNASVTASPVERWRSFHGKAQKNRLPVNQ